MDWPMTVPHLILWLDRTERPDELEGRLGRCCQLSLLLSSTTNTMGPQAALRYRTQESAYLDLPLFQNSWAADHDAIGLGIWISFWISWENWLLRLE